MNRKLFRQVWFADEKRNRSLTKILVFTDSGSLEIEPDSLKFLGKKRKFQVSNIKVISLARQQTAWVTYLIMNVLLIVYFVVLRRTFPEVYSFSVLLPLLVVANVFGLVIGYRTKWVRIEYADEKNANTQVFFGDGSFLGWGGILGGTEKMYQTLKLLMNRDEYAAS